MDERQLKHMSPSFRERERKRQANEEARDKRRSLAHVSGVEAARIIVETYEARAAELRAAPHTEAADDELYRLESQLEFAKARLSQLEQG